MAGEVKVPIGFDVATAMSDLGNLKTSLNQFGGQIKARFRGDVYEGITNGGRHAADKLYDYMKDLGATIAMQLVKSTDAFARYDATARAGAAVRSLPGAEYAAGTPEGQKMIDQMLRIIEPIAQQEAKGSQYIDRATGEPEALAALLGIKDEIRQLKDLMSGRGMTSGGAGR